MIDTIWDIFKLCLVDENIAEAIQVTSALCVWEWERKKLEQKANEGSTVVQLCIGLWAPPFYTLTGSINLPTYL